MKSKSMKFMIGIAAVFCLFLTVSQLYNFYYNHFPPFFEGECGYGSVHTNGVDIGVVFEVITNNHTEGFSDLVVGVQVSGNEIIDGARVSYAELRKLNFQKISCGEAWRE